MLVQVVTTITTTHNLETGETAHKAEIAPSDDGLPQVLTLAAVKGGCLATIAEVEALAPELVGLEND